MPLQRPAYLQLGWFGKVVARPENCVPVHPNCRDAHGIPIAVVRFRFGENDLALWQDSLQLDAGAQPGGFASHEVGTARLGKDPRRSVLNGYCPAHDVKNLFVTDGSAFTTSSEKNPTLTITALSLRPRITSGLLRE